MQRNLDRDYEFLDDARAGQCAEEQSFLLEGETCAWSDADCDGELMFVSEDLILCRKHYEYYKRFGL